MSWFGDAINWWHNNGLLTGIWKGATGQLSQEQIAEQNLEYQRERNEIEDARYEEETAYNRAFAENQREYERAFAEDERDYQRTFAEDERAYQRALQQQVFEREDTAIERQANSLSKLGINPLSQNMSGLGSGAVVSASNPASSVAPSASLSPSMSFRGGSALHNDFQPDSILESISPIMSFLNGMENMNTQGLQRDALREQNDYQRLLNQEKALQNRFLEQKLIDEQSGRQEDNRHKKTINPSLESSAKSSAERNERENVFQDTYGVTDNTPPYIRASTDITKQAERATDYVAEKIGGLSKQATDSLVKSAQKKLNDYGQSLKDGFRNTKGKFSKFLNWLNNFGDKYLSENY